MQTFADVHRWADIKICNYVARPRINHAVVPGNTAALGTLRPDQAFVLPANNAEARIAIAEIALEHIHLHAGISSGPVCFVTITPAKCAFPVGDERGRSREAKALCRKLGLAVQFDVRILQQIARQGLGDIPFIGMVEMALYRRWSPAGPAWGDWVSWHVHLITWGVPQLELSRRLALLRGRHDSMREGLASVHVKDVAAWDVGRQFLYALKAPQKIYRVEYFEHEWRNPITGEVKLPGWHTQKDWLQTGHRLRCVEVMGERTLDELLFGNDEGTLLARAIRDEAMAPFRAWERKQPYHQRC